LERGFLFKPPDLAFSISYSMLGLSPSSVGISLSFFCLHYMLSGSDDSLVIVAVLGQDTSPERAMLSSFRG
jgi:hypothetical protein